MELLGISGWILDFAVWILATRRTGPIPLHWALRTAGVLRGAINVTYKRAKRGRSSRSLSCVMHFARRDTKQNIRLFSLLRDRVIVRSSFYF